MGHEEAPAWFSYDGVAEIYERVAEPWFAALARDLVRAAQLRPGERVLDVGAGTGLVARCAVEAEPTLAVVAVDPSVRMLRSARGQRVTPVVGRAPGLPFADASFDAALANVVVSHFPDREAAVTDIARVLRPGGRFGMTSWSSDDGREGDLVEANELLATIRREHGLDLTPPRDAVPGEQWLEDRDNVRDLLDGAGFVSVEVHAHRSAVRLSPDDLVSGWGAAARYLRQVAGDDRWRRYAADGALRLRQRFGEHVDVVETAWVATGLKLS